jgi:tetratricopeptide (TPR) repeat protein
VKPATNQSGLVEGLLWSSLAAGLLLALAAGLCRAQAPAPPAPNQAAAGKTSKSLTVPAQAAPGQATPSQAVPPADAPSTSGAPAKPVKAGDRRRAVKLYLESSKLFEKEQFEEAMEGYEKASALDPSNADYRLAAEVARSHAVTALIQAAAKDRLRGDPAGARAALARALELDPRNAQVAERLHELGDDAVLGLTTPLYEESAGAAGEAEPLAPSAGVHSFHQRTGSKQLIEQVFKAYGLQASVDDSVHSTQVRLDIDDASFQQAAHVLGLLTNSFYVPVDAHRVLVARDTTSNRRDFMRQDLETIYLPGLTNTELTEIGSMAKSVFEAQLVAVEQQAGTITVRAPADTLTALNATLRELIDGRSQVLLEVRLIELAHTSTRNTGAELPQTMTAFNVYTEEQQILNANAGLVQQIISSGLAAPGDVEAIIAILIASGQVTSAFFSNGFALFGGGITLSALSPPPATAKFALNSSDSRELDEMQLRLGDGEKATLKTGMRYPIMTSSYSSLGFGGANIPGLTTPGSSAGLGGLAGLAGQLGSTAGIVPQVQYQDLGLNLTATPNPMRNGDVALTIEMKIDALGGSALNGVPVLDNRSYSGVVTVKANHAIVVMSELDRQETRAISGVPGLSEIPGLNDVTGNDTQKNYSTLLIVMTPHVIRGTHAAGHTQMMRVQRGTAAR